jgi:CDP-diglyceride synthetase
MGIILLVFAAIVPFPPIFTIPGVAWRIIIGLLGCFLVYKAIRFKKRNYVSGQNE